MNTRLFGLGAIGAACLCGQVMAAQAEREDCRTIADPAARLACYDQTNGRSVVPAPPSAPAIVGTRPTPGTGPAPSTPPPAGTRRSFQSRIVAVSPARHGLFELRLADGSVWTTTATVARPNVGDPVRYRRTFIGTHYFDIEGRRAITVRPER